MFLSTVATGYGNLDDWRKPPLGFHSVLRAENHFERLLVGLGFMLIPELANTALCRDLILSA